MGKVLKLGPIHTTLLSLLHEARGDWVPKQKMVNEVYGYDPPLDNTFRVHLSILRRKIKKFCPYVVESNGRGRDGSGHYRLYEYRADHTQSLGENDG